MALWKILPVLILGLARAVQGETLDYDVTYGPMRVGRLELEVRSADARYAASLSIRSAGLAGVVRAVRFAAWAEGRMADLPRPERYREEADTGRRVSQVRIDWQDGVAVVRDYRADPAETVPPALAAEGVLDPASAFVAALTGAQACGLAFAVFDGQRLSQVTLATGADDAGRRSCAGRFTRLAGYRPEDMEERQSFPLSLTYAAQDGRFVLEEAEVQTLYGKVRLKRR